MRMRLAEVTFPRRPATDFEGWDQAVQRSGSKAAGIPWRETWSVSTFGREGTYIISFHP